MQNSNSNSELLFLGRFFEITLKARYNEAKHISDVVDAFWYVYDSIMFSFSQKNRYFWIFFFLWFWAHNVWSSERYLNTYTIYIHIHTHIHVICVMICYIFKSKWSKITQIQFQFKIKSNSKVQYFKNQYLFQDIVY